jgi:hypothetical protein
MFECAGRSAASAVHQQQCNSYTCCPRCVLCAVSLCRNWSEAPLAETVRVRGYARQQKLSATDSFAMTVCVYISCKHKFVKQVALHHGSLECTF